MNKIYFKNLEIEHICKKNLKNTYITISNDAKVILKTPKVSQNYIESLLTKKELWIKKKLEEIKKNKPVSINIEKEVLLFGEIYSIDASEIYILRKLLQKLKVYSVYNIQKCHDIFYEEFSHDYLTDRVKYFASLMNLKFTQIKYKKLKSRWGSCDTKKTITLNTQLLKIEKDLIDYVIVHELSHLVHLNHSKEFHSYVNSFLPNSKGLIKRLKAVRI